MNVNAVHTLMMLYGVIKSNVSRVLAPHRKPKTASITFRIMKDFSEIRHDLEGYGKWVLPKR